MSGHHPLNCRISAKPDGRIPGPIANASPLVGLVLILTLCGAVAMAANAAARQRGPLKPGSSVPSARAQALGARGIPARIVLSANRSPKRGGGRRRNRLAVHVVLVRRGVLSAEGAVAPAGAFKRALMQMRDGPRWKAVHRRVPIRGNGKFAVRWKLEPHTSKVEVRAIALGKGRKRLVSRVTTLRIGAHGSAAYTVPATTRVYAGKEVRSAKAGPSGETLVELAPGSAKPVAGGHVALGPSPSLPFGMFASVAGVSSAGKGWTVGLRRAPIDQVFDNVSLHFDQDVKPQVVDSLGQPIASRSRSGAIRISGPAAFAHASSFGSVFSCKSSGKSKSADSAFDSTRPLPLSIELSHLHALDDFDEGSLFPHRDPFFLMQVNGEAQASIGFQAKSSFSCELSDSYRETHRLAFPLGAVGPVPVTMYLEPTLKFEVSGSGTVSLSQHHYWGITLEQNGFSPFKAHLAHSADPVDFHANAAIGASLFAGGDLSVMFGAGEGAWAVQAGIYGEFGPDFELATSTEHLGCLTATAKLEADLGVRLQVLVKRWSAKLASLTTSPVNLGGPWCVGSGGGSGAPGGGGGGDGGGGGGSGGGTAGSMARSLAATQESTCAIVGTGAVECWGGNQRGELGGGSTGGYSTEPVPVDGISTAVAITMGDWPGPFSYAAGYACALLDDGSIRCWGDNERGELGEGPSGVTSAVPVVVEGLGPAAAVAASDGSTYVSNGGEPSHACALERDHKVFCWGWGANGQLGDGVTGGPGYSASPVEVQGITDATGIAAGASFSCALLSDSSVSCWGIRLPGTGGATSFTPTAVPGLSSVVAIEASGEQFCAVTASGTAKCMGQANTTIPCSGAPSDTCGGAGSGGNFLGSTTGVTGVSVGPDHECALYEDGHLGCGGFNQYGQLGIGAITGSVEEPGVATGTVAGVSGPNAVVAASSHTCASLTSGSIVCWGRNDLGQLGTGTTDNSSVPTAVQGLP